MRLFSKTLLSFTGVILFEAALTVVLLTNSIEAGNRAEARRELENEARLAYDSFNSWKRDIWKNLIELDGDEQLAELARRAAHGGGLSAVSAYLRVLFLRTGYDVVYFSLLPQGFSSYIPITYSTFSLTDLEPLHLQRAHPYVEITRIGTGLAIAGATRVPTEGGAALAVFIIKRIDENFCDALTLNRSSACALFLDDTYLTGGGAPISGASPPVSLSAEDSYAETYSWPWRSARYNVAVQRVPNLSASLEGRKLELATFVANLPYEQRLRSIGDIVLFASAASVALTLLLSLILTNNIAVPIRRLLRAMRRFQSGEYATAPAGRSSFEIAQLLDGFNDMAAKLHEDRLEADRFIKEITFLNEYNETVIDSIRSGILVLDDRGLVQKANRSFLTMFGLREVEISGKVLTELGADVFDRKSASEVGAIRAGAAESLESVRRSRSGRVYEMKLYPLHTTQRSSKLGCILVVDDVTRRVELEEKIYQAEKLSSLSMLSAGVAHEINNPLSSIMTNVQNLLTDDHDEETRESLKWIERETRRIASTVQELLRFSASDGDSDAGCDVNAAIEEALTLVGYSLGRGSEVEIRRLLGGDLPAANIGANELKQVVINLVKNSLQATGGPGTITVRTAYRRGRVSLSVADTGTGMAPEVVSHIFDPFFTTKRNGDGSGLGLSVVYGILTKYRATIRVSSHLGRGTRMTISMLPLDPAGAGRNKSR